MAGYVRISISGWSVVKCKWRVSDALLKNTRETNKIGEQCTQSKDYGNGPITPARKTYCNKKKKNSEVTRTEGLLHSLRLNPK